MPTVSAPREDAWVKIESKNGGGARLCQRVSREPTRWESLELFKAKVVNSGVDISKRYALLREAVSGTMSKFYKAKDLRTCQLVGLKILDRQRTSAFEERFRGLKKPTEGEVGMLLKHPRLVETFEHGTTANGSQYIAMEFIDGPDFNSLIVARDPILEENRVHFIRQAAEAVAAVQMRRASLIATSLRETSCWPTATRRS